jgi:hypothetical protein
MHRLLLTIFAMILPADVGLADGIILRACFDHRQYIEHPDRNRVEITIQIRNDTSGNVTLPTEHMGPIVGGPTGESGSRMIELLYAHSLGQFRDGSKIVLSRVVFAPVDLKPGQSTIIRESVAWPESWVPDILVVRYVVNKELCSRYGFTPCDLKTTAKKGEPPL